MTYIAQDNLTAAQALKDGIEAKAAALSTHPKLYKPGRIKGTREMVVRPNYVVVYREDSGAVTDSACAPCNSAVAEVEHIISRETTSGGFRKRSSKIIVLSLIENTP